MRIATTVWVCVLAAAGGLAGETPEEAVRGAQQRWIESYNRHDAEALSAAEAEDFRLTLSDGRVQGKTEQLAAIRKPLPDGAEFAIAVEESEVRVYGSSAVVRGVVTESGKVKTAEGTSQTFHERSRYTDTWILEKGVWRVVASHLSAIRSSKVQ